MLNFYIYQRKNLEVGNFINCSASIMALFNKYQEKIPVYFDTPVVRDMYLKSPYIEIIEKDQIGDRKQLFSSLLHNQSIPDFQYIFNTIDKLEDFDNKEVPHTFVDNVPCPYDKDAEYVVVARGCLSTRPDKILAKDPGDEIYKLILEEIGKTSPIVFIGGEKEREVIDRMASWDIYPVIEVGDIRRSIGIINGSQFAVMNDTGAAGIAGALNKEIFIIWKDTNFNKNRNPGKNNFYSFQPNWFKDFMEWYK